MTASQRQQGTIPEHGFGIRMESIGGLGANLAGKMLAEAGVLHMGLNGSQFSSYGSEKKGSPVTTYVRFTPGQRMIRVTEPIDYPDVIAVFHEARLRDPACIRGLVEGGILIVNTSRTPEEIWSEVGLKNVTIVCVDATQIAIDERTRANTAMLGTMCEVVDFLSPDAVKQSIEDAFGKKYKDMVLSNVKTFERGYAELRQQSFTEAADVTGKKAAPVLSRGTHVMGGVIAAAGNSVQKDLSGSRQGFLPEFKVDSCINCAACDQVCPDFCFVWENREDAKGRKFQYLVGIDYQYCKGCLKCIEACPTDALEKMRETDDYAEENRVAHVW